tara:strand:- start:1842 stop:3395 length:1554 start_codon:yes stop_codon:yes gene_type:complete
MDQIADRMLQKYERAKQARVSFEPLFEDCFEYALPMRQSFYSETAGQRRDDKIFDETAVVGVQEFASRLQSGLVPNFARWADFVAGSEIPKEEQDKVNNSLDEVTEYVFEVIQNSNFGQEIHESFMDLAVGTGVLLVEEGDAINPVRFNAIPLPSVHLDTGPDDKIDHIYRERTLKNSEIPIAYPKAILGVKTAAAVLSQPDTEKKILEVICRNYSEPNEDNFDYYVVNIADKEIIFQEAYKGTGSNPFVCFRWSKASGEVYGRGPLINALSAIKTTNLTIELVLENAQMAISGVYQMDDDGIINTDTINLVPGTIIPKAMGSAGLQPIKNAGNFDVANLVLNDMRTNIKRALYNDMLGDPNKTPASATEIAERMADLSRRIGSAFGRLQAEMVQPVLQRVVYILKKQGRIELPNVNGREVKVRSVSPLAQAQANQDISAVSRYLQMVGGTFGPEVLNVLINSEDVALYLAKKFGVPDNLVRDKVERQQLLEAAQKYQQQQQQQGQDATAIPSLGGG